MIGRTISHYHVLETLGAGGMRSRLQSGRRRLGRLVGLKMVSEHLTDRAGIERFEREACAAWALNHANICTIYEIDQVDGKPFALPFKPILAKERDEALEFSASPTRSSRRATSAVAWGPLRADPSFQTS